MSTAFGSIGLNLMVTVLFKQAYDITGDELDIGLLGLAQFIPAVLLVLVSGWVADRFDRRRVTALFLFARALCAGALVIYSMADPTSAAADVRDRLRRSVLPRRCCRPPGGRSRR